MKTFMLAYRYKACNPGMKEQVVEISNHGSGIRDTARVLKISKSTVISTLKKSSVIIQVNPNFQVLNPDGNVAVRVELACDEAEMDEQWSYVGNRSNKRWLWYAVDHASNTLLSRFFAIPYVRGHERRCPAFRCLHAFQQAVRGSTKERHFRHRSKSGAVVFSLNQP